ERVQVPQRAVAVDAQPDDRELVEVDLRDDRRVDLRGQPVGGGGDGVADVLHGDVHALAQPEVDRDGADPLRRLRLDRLDPFHLRDGVFDDVGDVVVDDLGGTAVVVGG